MNATIDSASRATEPMLFTCIRAMEVLHISRTKLWQIVREGMLPVVRIGSRVFFRPNDIREFIDRNVVTIA
jgi:predicted DNA-binding transcriptional regulator AlpA